MHKHFILFLDGYIYYKYLIISIQYSIIKSLLSIIWTFLVIGKALLVI